MWSTSFFRQMKIALIALDHQHGKLEHVVYGLELKSEFYSSI